MLFKHYTFLPKMLFITFPLKYYLYKIFKWSNKEYLLLIYCYTFIGMITFRTSIHFSSKVTIWFGNGAESGRTVLQKDYANFLFVWGIFFYSVVHPANELFSPRPSALMAPYPPST